MAAKKEKNARKLDALKHVLSRNSESLPGDSDSNTKAKKCKGESEMMKETYNEIERIRECVESMSDADVICIWNEYCDEARRYDDRIEDMSYLPDLFDTSTADGLTNLLNRFYFGQDGRDKSSSANPTRDYFYFNGYGNIVSTDDPFDAIEVDELAQYIVENRESFGSDEIQEILDGEGEEKED